MLRAGGLALSLLLSPLYAQDASSDAETGAPPAIPEVKLDNPDALIQAGDAALAKGDWLNAAANYQGLLEIAKRTGAPQDRLEPLYFSLGAAYFNINHFDKAREIFTEYTSKYPKAANAFQAHLALARILAAQKNWPDAIKKYEPLRPVAPPMFREDVHIELANAYKENAQSERAIALLEPLVAASVKTTNEVRQALALIELYSVDSPEKGVALLERVKRSPGARPLSVEINFAALKLADELMAAEKEEQALRAYQNLRKKSELLETLTELIAEYERTITRLQGVLRLRNNAAAAASAQLDRVRLFHAQAKAQREALEKEHNYDAVVIYRISRCFTALGRYWEARLGFNHVLENFKDFEDRATALFGVIVCTSRLVPEKGTEDPMKLAERTEELCRRYMKEYPDGPNIQQVAEVLIAQAGVSGDTAKVNAVYEEVMSFLENSPNKAQFLAIRVQNYLEQGQTDKAREAAETFRAQAGDSPMMEDVDFLYALTYFFENKATESLRELKAYRDKYPNGRYLADARYRLAMIMKGEALAERRREKGRKSNFMEVIQECEAIIKDYPGTPTAGDCWALIGDCYKEMTGAEMEKLKLGADEVDKRAANAYMEAALRGASEELVEYGLSQARPLLIAQGRWKDVETLYRDFLRANPDHRLALEAVNWIGKAIKRQGATPEQRAENAERALRFLADTVLETLNDPSKEGVEELLRELALSVAPKRRTAPAAGADAEAAKPRVLSVEELGAEAEAKLEELLGVNEEGKLNGTARARLVYAKHELYITLEARAPKKRDASGKLVVDNAPKKSDQLMEQLATGFTPDDLSARLLAVAGDYFLKRGLQEQAAVYFNRLVQFFPQSLFMDWGLVGLGDLAYAEKDYETAERRYTQAIEEYPGSKYGEAMLGRCRVLYESEKYQEAEKSLKEMFGDKHYPPEVKAEVTWLLGEVRFKMKDYAEAFNYFQRLYLSFKKFPNWMARGFLRAGETKEALGKPVDAVEVYRRAVNDEKNASRMAGEPDFEKVKARKRALGD